MVLRRPNFVSHPVLSDGWATFTKQKFCRRITESRQSTEGEVLVIQSEVSTHLCLNCPHDRQHPRLAIVRSIRWIIDKVKRTLYQQYNPNFYKVEKIMKVIDVSDI